MDKPRPGVRKRGSRSALRTVSNYQSTLAGGWSSPPDSQKTPTQRISFAQRAKTESSKKFSHSVHRRLSQSHGDLSKLRPKSPPIRSLPAELCGLRPSPGNFADDSRNHFSPSYSKQSRQALPSNWTADRPVTRSNEASIPLQLSSYEDLLPSINAVTGNVKPVAIAIQGLSPGISSPLDFGKDVTRIYPNNDHDRGCTIRGLAVQHIDVKTSWNFSSYSEAQELYRIHQAFATTLERILASELWNVYLRDCNPKIGKDEGCLTAEIIRGISFCREQLVGDMADSLYSTQEDIRVRAQLGLIRLYLAAGDCLVQYDGAQSRDTSITVRVHHDRRSQEPYPFVQAAWVPDSITFKNLDSTRFPHEGQEFSIIPQYQCNSAFASTRFPTNVRYSIKSEYTPLSWLTWDDHIAGFKGIVPMYSAKNTGACHRNFFAPVELLCINVEAVIVEDNGFSVQFERTVRARLVIDILPWNDSFAPRPCRGTGSDPTPYSFNAQGVDRNEPSSIVSSVETSSSSQFYDGCQPYFSSEHRTGPVSSTSKPYIKAGSLLDLAQQDAYLAAKYEVISRRLADTENYVRFRYPLGGYDQAQIQRQQPDLQFYSAGYHGSTPLSNPLGMCPPTTGGSLTSSYISKYASDNKTPPLHGSPQQTAPPLPRINGMAAVQDQINDTSSNVRFPALPPPAVRSTTSQVFDDITQAWTPKFSPQITPTHHSHRSGSETRQMRPTPQHRPTSRSLDEHPNANCYLPRSPREEDIGDLRSADVTQDPATPFVSMIDGAKTLKPKEASRKWHARWSTSNASYSKRPKENKYLCKASTSEMGMACYSLLPKDRDSTPDVSGVQAISALDVPHPVGRSEGDASVPMRREPTSPQPRIDSGHQSGLHNVGSEAQPLRSLVDPIQFLYGVPTPPDSLNSMSPAVSDPEAGGQSPWECGSGQEGPTKKYTLYQTFYTSERSPSVFSWQTSGTLSRAASSNIEITLENPHERAGRREQAKVWHRLSDSESSDKENKPGAAGAEARLNEDEKMVMQEAIERNLDDMTQGFNGVFLNDSDDLASGDEMPAND